MQNRLVPFLSVFLVFSAFLCGCGGANKISGVKVSVVLLKKGQPFVAPDKYETVVSFLGNSNDGKSIAAPGVFDATKNVYDIPGPTGTGLPAGTYKVMVRCAPYAGSDDQDLFKGRFLIGRDAKNPKTPLSCTITDGKSHEVTIDLDSKQLTIK